MKELLLTFLLIFSTNAHSSIFENYLDHMDIVHLSSLEAGSKDFSVNYPGLGQRRYDNPDCLALISDSRSITKDQAEDLKNKILLSDGAGILFNDGGRDINPLTPEITQIRFGKSTLIFKLKDLGTYVTGVRISTFSPYISFSGIIRLVFGEEREDLSLQFLRGCEL